MDKKLISIIVPIYNVERYLDKCISSIIKQTYENLEIILVDDGSTDHSGAICDRYAMEEERIKVVHRTNGGPASARREGINMASGHYIGFVDGDDFIEEQMYEMLVQYMEEMQVDFVHSGYFKNDEQRFSVKSREKYVLTDKKSREKILKKMILDPTDCQSVVPSIWSKLFKKDFLKEVYESIGDRLSYGEDLWCLCACIMRCDSFGTVPEAWYHYVKREDSICNERNVENVQREMELYAVLKEMFDNYGLSVGMKDELGRFYLRNLLTSMKKLTNITCPIYQYPVMEELVGKKILIYGMGEVGRDYYVQFRMDMRCTLCAVSDRNIDKCEYDFIKMIRIDEVAKHDYDVIVIAVLKEELAQKIADDLLKKGVEREKIIWRQPKLAV